MTAQKVYSDKNMNGRKVTNLGAPAAASNDAVRQVDLDNNATADRNRANHTGTQTASTISNFDAQVRTSTLNQMAAPTADLSLATHKLINVVDPTNPSDGATKNYVDSQLSGVTSGQVLKGAVRVGTTVNVSVASPGATIDGVTMAAGDIVLLGGQTAGAENGPWVWNGAATAMTRPTNWDSSSEAVLGSYWIVREGTYKDSFALMTNDTAITLGTTSIVIYFTSTSNIGRYAADLPAIAAGATYNVVHNLGSQDVTVQFRTIGSPMQFVNDIYAAVVDGNTVQVAPDAAIAASELRVIVKY